MRRQERSCVRRAGSWAFGLAVAVMMAVAPAGAQHVARTSGPAKVHRRGVLHPYHVDRESAIKATRMFEGPAEVRLDPARGKDQFDLTIGKNRFRNRNAEDVKPPGETPPPGSPPGTVYPMPHVFELLCYNGQRVGPTLRVQPGTTFKIRVRNAIHGEVDPGVDPLDAIPGASNPTAENVHGLCTTNLHTHGLHVSPSGDADNIFRQVEPGEEFTYEYTLRPDHPAGTYWYHPHKHGSTAYQLSNGLSGALIVEGNRADDLDQNPEILKMKEKVLVLQSYTFGAFTDPIEQVPVGFIDGVSIYNANEKKLATCDSIQPDAGTLIRGQPGSPWTALAINGVLVPKFELQPREVERWRVVHAGWDVQRTFAFYKLDAGKDPVPTTDIQVYEVAADGITTGRLDAKIDPAAKAPFSKWTIAPGQRSDVLIRPNPPAGSAPTTYYMMVPPAPSDPPGTSPYFVAKLEVGDSGKPKATALPDPADLKKRVPKCLEIPATDKDVAATIPTAGDVNLVATAAATVTPTPTPLGYRSLTNTISIYSNDTTHTYTVNGLTFHSLALDPIPLKLGTVQSWNIRVDENSDSGHPFHIHVNPFLVMSSTDSGGVVTPMTPPVWRDTVYVEPGLSYQIRSKFRDIEGLAVMHCHILDHEDQGMMWPIKLSRQEPPTNGAEYPPPPPSAPAPGSPSVVTAGAVAALKPEGLRAPAVRLPDILGKPRDLDEFRGRKVALVFFRGTQCFHCAEQLRDLVRDARDVLGADAEVVAISPGRIKDPAKALAALGVKASDRFHLLVDESSRAFRDYGCLDGEPRHGLFLIDEAGMIRWRYAGDLPFADTRLAVNRLRDLPAPPQARPAADPARASAMAGPGRD